MHFVKSKRVQTLLSIFILRLKQNAPLRALLFVCKLSSFISIGNYKSKSNTVDVILIPI